MAIQTMMSGSAAKDYVERNRYDSFAPVRPNSYVNWCVSQHRSDIVRHSPNPNRLLRMAAISTGLKQEQNAIQLQLKDYRTLFCF